MHRHAAAHPKPATCIPRLPPADLPCIDRRPVAAAVSPNNPHRAVGLDVAIGIPNRGCRGDAGEDVKPGGLAPAGLSVAVSARCAFGDRVAGQGVAVRGRCRVWRHRCDNRVGGRACHRYGLAEGRSAGNDGGNGGRGDFRRLSHHALRLSNRGRITGGCHARLRLHGAVIALSGTARYCESDGDGGG